MKVVNNIQENAVVSNALEVKNEIFAIFGIEDLSIFENALLSGHAEASRSTYNDAAFMHGTRMWNGVLSCLRDQLITSDWKTERPNNLELTSSPRRKLSILVASGDKYTGQKNGTPSNKNGGKKTGLHSAVSCNQDILPGLEDYIMREKIRPQTWLFLFHIDDQQGVISQELSLPSAISGGHVTKWEKRLILPAVATSSPTTINRNSDTDTFVDVDNDVTIEITKKFG
jgi:hypothetical protein